MIQNPKFEARDLQLRQECCHFCPDGGEFIEGKLAVPASHFPLNGLPACLINWRDKTTCRAHRYFLTLPQPCGWVPRKVWGTHTRYDSSRGDLSIGLSRCNFVKAEARPKVKWHVSRVTHAPNFCLICDKVWSCRINARMLRRDLESVNQSRNNSKIGCYWKNRCYPSPFQGLASATIFCRI